MGAPLGLDGRTDARIVAGIRPQAGSGTAF